MYQCGGGIVTSYCTFFDYYFSTLGYSMWDHRLIVIDIIILFLLLLLLYVVIIIVFSLISESVCDVYMYILQGCMFQLLITDLLYIIVNILNTKQSYPCITLTTAAAASGCSDGGRETEGSSTEEKR